MGDGSETGGVTGTKDKDYNLVWFSEACLSNALRMSTGHDSHEGPHLR